MEATKGLCRLLSKASHCRRRGVASTSPPQIGTSGITSSSCAGLLKGPKTRRSETPEENSSRTKRVWFSPQMACAMLSNGAKKLASGKPTLKVPLWGRKKVSCRDHPPVDNTMFVQQCAGLVANPCLFSALSTSNAQCHLQLWGGTVVHPTSFFASQARYCSQPVFFASQAK